MGKHSDPVCGSAMQRPSLRSLVLVVLVTASLAASLSVIVVGFATPIPEHRTAHANAEFLNPVTPLVVDNATFPDLSSVTFHWNVEGFAPNFSASVVDPYNSTIYGEKVSLTGSEAGSGSFVAAPGTYRFEFSGLTGGVADVSVAIEYGYLTDSPLL